MERMEMIKMTPDSKSRDPEGGDLGNQSGNVSDLLDDEEDLFDFITRWGSERVITVVVMINVNFYNPKYNEGGGGVHPSPPNVFLQ